MKNRTVLTIVALISCMYSFGQHHKQVRVVYDFNKKDVQDTLTQYGSHEKSVDKMWFGKRAYFSVMANPYLYDVYITGKQVNDEMINDTSEKTTFTTAFTNTKNAVTQSDKANAQTPKTPDSVKQSNNANPTVAQVLLKSIQPTINSESPNGIIMDTVLTFLKNAPNNPDLRSVANTIKNSSLASDNKSITLSQLNNSRIYSSVLKNSIDLIHNYNINADTVEVREQNDYISDHNLFIAAIDSFKIRMLSLKTYMTVCDQILLLLLTDRLSADEIYKRIDNELRTYYHYADGAEQFISGSSFVMYGLKNDILDAFDVIDTNFTNLKENRESLSVYKGHNFESDSLLYIQYKKVDSLINVSYTDVIPKSLSAMLVNMNIKYPGAFVHNYHVELVTKDTMEYVVQLKPSSRYDSIINLYGIKLYHIDSFTYSIPVKGNFKLNFSVGLSAVFNPLISRSYYYQPTADTGIVQIKQAALNNRYTPVISAFVHGYLKFGGWVTPAITVGVSTNPINLANSTYMLGLSAIFGHQSRFIFTIGVAGGSVDYLKGKYQLDTDYTKFSLTGVSESDLTQSTFRLGPFFGFSYNISNNR